MFEFLNVKNISFLESYSFSLSTVGKAIKCIVIFSTGHKILDCVVCGKSKTHSAFFPLFHFLLASVIDGITIFKLCL